jgi:hypothetical protein
LSKNEIPIPHKRLAYILWFGFIALVIIGGMYIGVGLHSSLSDLFPLNSNITPESEGLTAYEKWAVNTALGSISSIQMYPQSTTTLDNATFTIYRIEITALGHNLTAYASQETHPDYTSLKILNVTESGTLIWKP